MSQQRYVSIACVALALVTATSGVVRAAPGAAGVTAEPDDPIERARLHFKLGVDFYRERNYRAALIEFQRAYAASPHYKLLYNLGQASLELQEDSSAIEYFSKYLGEGANEIADERRSEVEQNLLKLRARLATVTVSTNQPGAEIYMDETRIGVAPLNEPVRVTAGRRKFVAVKHGYPDAERVIDVASGDALKVELEFKDRPQIDLAKLRLAVNAPKQDEPMSPALWTGIATGALAAAAGTMSILTMVAQNTYDEEKKGLTTRSELDRLRDDAKTKALVSDVLWGATIVGAGVTAVLIFTTGDNEREVAPGVALHVNPVGMKLAGRF
jgi:tetratricopeptide (TPR) repeat protein